MKKFVETFQSFPPEGRRRHPSPAFIELVTGLLNFTSIHPESIQGHFARHGIHARIKLMITEDYINLSG